MYLQTWLIDWVLFICNLEKQVKIFEVRVESDSDVFERDS